MRSPWSAVAAADGSVHLPLDIHLLLTAWTATPRRSCASSARPMQILDQHPVLSGPSWTRSAAGRPARRCRSSTRTWRTEDVPATFDTLPSDFRLSVSYLPADRPDRRPRRTRPSRRDDRRARAHRQLGPVPVTTCSPTPVDQRIARLAVGNEPLDAVTGARMPGAAAGARRPPAGAAGPMAPLAAGQDARHRPQWTGPAPSGRTARCTGPGPGSGTWCCGWSQPRGRRFVPRRVGVHVPDQGDAGQRTSPFGLFPGAAAALPSRVTVVRGQLVTGTTAVRWARVRAVDAAGDEVGWGAR